MVAAQSVDRGGHARSRRSARCTRCTPTSCGRAVTTRRSASSCTAIRDGRSFTTRRVVAHQAGEAIFNLAASFALPEAGIEHQDPAPEAPPPEACEDWEKARARVLGDARFERESAAEVRISAPLPPGAARARRARRSGCACAARRPTTRCSHTALLVYMTDRTLASTAARPHGLPWGMRMTASLDHAVWIHRPFRLDGALAALRQRESRRARRARHHLRRHVPGRRAHRVGRAGGADPGCGR